MTVRRIAGLLGYVVLLAVPFLIVVSIASRIFGFEMSANIGVAIAWIAYLLVISWIVRRRIRDPAS